MIKQSDMYVFNKKELEDTIWDAIMKLTNPTCPYCERGIGPDTYLSDKQFKEWLDGYLEKLQALRKFQSEAEGRWRFCSHLVLPHKQMAGYCPKKGKFECQGCEDFDDVRITAKQAGAKNGQYNG